MPSSNARSTYYRRHRAARMSALGSLACSCSQAVYQWFLREVYDLRFPRVGGRDQGWLPRSFDALRGRMVRYEGVLVRLR